MKSRVFSAKRLNGSREQGLTTQFGLAILFFVAISNSALRADEVVINQSNSQPVRAGDFSLSFPSAGGFSTLPFADKNQETTSNLNVTMTAGELWKFFKSQGIESVDRLTLQIDLDKTNGCCDMALDSVSLSIHDGESKITEAFLGVDNKVVIKHADILQFKPEAQMEMGLGFDFMKRFSADSKEIIVLRTNVVGADPQKTSITIQGRRRYFTFPNLIAVTGFLAFWVFMFLVLRKLALPDPVIKPVKVTQSAA
ncbi:MAG: hypothetical protein ABL888_12540 [Pirellulaceae bacterium]